MRIVVAMSGGVDSSAAAALLVQAGHEVIGVSLKLDRSRRSAAPGRCCSPDDLEDARKVAGVLGIPFYVFDATELFDEKVVRPFVADYLAGTTPIPCLACNRDVKFGHLLSRARALGAQLATGHYARIEREPGKPVRLLRGADRSRDQSYFLYELGQEELVVLELPVGALHKAESREAARGAGLAVADKAESQDICFIPDGDAAGFVARQAGERARPGRIVAADGTDLGAHDGVHGYTVGQRKGLRISARLPLYVQALRPESGEVVVGPGEALDRTGLFAVAARWVSGAPPEPGEQLSVQVRHRHAAVPCTVEVRDGGFLVHAQAPIRAPAPGQAAVLYRGDEVVGGGIIARDG